MEGNIKDNIKLLKIDKFFHEEFKINEADENPKFNAEFNHEWNVLLRDKILNELVEMFKNDWRKYYVIYPILWPAEMSEWIRRLYFILYEIHAPTLKWFKWF